MRTRATAPASNRPVRPRCQSLLAAKTVWRASLRSVTAKIGSSSGSCTATSRRIRQRSPCPSATTRSPSESSNHPPRIPAAPWWPKPSPPEPGARLTPAEPQHDGVDDHVVAGGQLGVESHAELDERREAAADVDPPRVGLVDARDALEQRALAASVATHDPEELALRDLERHV